MITNHTLSKYDHKLQELKDAFLDMGELVKGSMLLTQQTLTDRQPDLYAKIKENDKKINLLDDKIEELVTQIIALMNPMAMDLRFITSALKVSLYLERAGDLAKNTTKRLSRLEIEIPTQVKTMLEELIKVDIRMLEAALEAVKNSDADQAIHVWKSDDEADDLCKNILEGLRHHMTLTPNEAPHLVDIMFAAKNLERFADYATNLAKTVHYVLTGEKPKKNLLNQ